jgi:hypothetical protein
MLLIVVRNIILGNRKVLMPGKLAKCIFKKYYEKGNMAKQNKNFPFCLLPFCPFTQRIQY